VTRRLAAALLAFLALGLHLGVTLPFRRERDGSRQEWAEAREERESLRSRRSRLERAAARPAPSGDAAAVRALRQSLLRAAERLPLAAVRIAVEAGGGVAARGRFSAEGAQPDLLRAAERLADPSSGVLLERVTLLPGQGGELRLEVRAVSLRAGPEAGS